MSYYKLEIQDKSIYLTISNSKCGCAAYFMGGIGLFMFLFPIYALLFVVEEITFASILVCLFAWTVSGYFFKLYLWNKYGKDVFIIKENLLKTYNDYKLFKDNFKVYPYDKIDILFFKEDKTLYISELKKHINFVDKNELSVIGFKLNKEIITSHKELPISEIMKIANQIKKIGIN